MFTMVTGGHVEVSVDGAAVEEDTEWAVGITSVEMYCSDVSTVDSSDSVWSGVAEPLSDTAAADSCDAVDVVDDARVDWRVVEDAYREPCAFE